MEGPVRIPGAIPVLVEFELGNLTGNLRSRSHEYPNSGTDF